MIMRSSDIRKRNTADLTALLAEKQEALRSFRFGLSRGRNKNVKEARTIRTIIARIKTEMTSRRRIEAHPS